MDHREAGYHHHQKQEVSINTVSSWQEERELENLPDYPIMLDLWLNINSRLAIYYARKIWKTSDFVIVRFVEEDEEIVQLELNIEGIKMNNSITIYLVSSEQLAIKLLSLGVSKVAIYNYNPVGFDPGKKDLVLRELSSYGNKILTLPNNVTLSDIDLPKERLRLFTYDR